MSSLLCLLVAARLGAGLLERARQPGMIGEILAGMLLGPSLLGWVAVTPEIKVISELGVFLLVLLAGLEVDPFRLLQTTSGKGLWVAVASFAVPVVLGCGVGAAFGLDAPRTAFLGLCVAITALPVSVRILMDLGQLQSPTGQRILSAAIFNDAAALLLLGVILDLGAPSEDWTAFGFSVAAAVSKALLFMAGVAVAYRLAAASTGRFFSAASSLKRGLERLKTKEALFAAAIVFVLAFAAFSERLGLHPVIGAFFGAMMLGHGFLGDENLSDVRRTASGVAMGFLAPVFFAVIGLEFSVLAFKSPWFMAAVLGAAFAGKIGGGILGARLAGLSAAEGRALGAGLNARGVMELLIADIAFSRGFIGPDLFSSLVLMAVVTTLATPWMLRRAMRDLSSA